MVSVVIQVVIVIHYPFVVRIIRIGRASDKRPLAKRARQQDESYRINPTFHKLNDYIKQSQFMTVSYTQVARKLIGGSRFFQKRYLCAFFSKMLDRRFRDCYNWTHTTTGVIVVVEQGATVIHHPHAVRTIRIGRASPPILIID